MHTVVEPLRTATRYLPHVQSVYREGRARERGFCKARAVTGKYIPVLVFTREKTRRSPIESWCRRLSHWQNEYKAQADQIFDRSPFDTLPPLKVATLRTRIKINPEVQVSEQRPGDIGWMEPPRRGAELAFELMGISKTL